MTCHPVSPHHCSVWFSAFRTPFLSKLVAWQLLLFLYSNIKHDFLLRLSDPFIYPFNNHLLSTYFMSIILPLNSLAWVCVWSLQLFASSPNSLWACQAPLYMELSKQEYWSKLPFPTPGALPAPRIESEILHLLHWQADCLPLSHWESPGKVYSCSTQDLCKCQIIFLESFPSQIFESDN